MIVLDRRRRQRGTQKRQLYCSHDPGKREWLYVTVHRIYQQHPCREDPACSPKPPSVCDPARSIHKSPPSPRTGSHAGMFGPSQHQLCWWELYLQTAAGSTMRKKWRLFSFAPSCLTVNIYLFTFGKCMSEINDYAKTNKNNFLYALYNFIEYSQIEISVQAGKLQIYWVLTNNTA